MADARGDRLGVSRGRRRASGASARSPSRAARRYERRNPRVIVASTTWSSSCPIRVRAGSWRGRSVLAKSGSCLRAGWLSAGARSSASRALVVRETGASSTTETPRSFALCSAEERSAASSGVSRRIPATSPAWRIQTACAAPAVEGPAAAITRWVSELGLAERVPSSRAQVRTRACDPPTPTAVSLAAGLRPTRVRENVRVREGFPDWDFGGGR